MRKRREEGRGGEGRGEERRVLHFTYRIIEFLYGERCLCIQINKYKNIPW
jgi:hypothetical protein